ncbi:MAG: hypothetical protein H6736_04430 [Alphaproteobacteria bacterium]|nr:hypothetical protein [Alphaproteobacteria bacterium]
MSDQPTGRAVEIICRFGVTAQAVAAAITTFLTDLGIEAEGCIVYERNIGSLLDLPEAVSQSGKPHFRAEVGPVVADMGGVRNYGHTLVTVEAKEPLPWRPLVEGVDGLVLARAHDVQYDHWQNAEDPLVYQAAGRSMDGLPMKSNGLPFPLEQQVVDTSRNAGRRVLRQGYVEAIGHRMWLGPEYFARVPGADRDAIMNAGWLQVTEMENGILEVVASDEPFTDDSTADIQNRLRRLLFPTTA